MTDKWQSMLSMSQMGNRLVVGIQGDIAGPNLDALHSQFLERLQDNSIHTVIFDMSAVAVIDLYEFQALVNLVRMVELMGASTLLIGLNAGIAAFLAEANADLSAIRIARDLDDVDRILQPSRAGRH